MASETGHFYSFAQFYLYSAGSSQVISRLFMLQGKGFTILEGKSNNQMIPYEQEQWEGKTPV